MNEVTNRSPHVIMPQSKVFDALPDPWDDMSHGVAISFPILGIKGGKWHYRWKGDDNIIPDASGRFPAPAVSVVILNAQKQMSRTYYESGYVEGVNNPPDCWSSDGVRPDETVTDPVNPTCALCPKSAWGSAGKPEAPKAQACQQRRRTVVVPYMEGGDLSNELGGGPMLLSVPPGSLANQAAYTNKLKEAHVHYTACVTELSFSQDANIAFPKIEFRYVKSVSDAEANFLVEFRENEAVNNILNSRINVDGPNAEVDQPDAPVTPQGAPPVGAAPRTAAPPQAAAPRASAVKRAPQPQAQPAPMAHTQAAQAAPAPAPTPASKVGGFAVGQAPAAPAAPVAESAIQTAMSKPAAAPVSARPVATPASTIKEMPPAVVEDETDEEQEVVAEGKVPDAMSDLFNNLMAG